MWIGILKSETCVFFQMALLNCTCLLMYDIIQEWLATGRHVNHVLLLYHHKIIILLLNNWFSEIFSSSFQSLSMPDLMLWTCKDATLLSCLTEHLLVLGEIFRLKILARNSQKNAFLTYFFWLKLDSLKRVMAVIFSKFCIWVYCTR